jgi:rhodanese-related sulfurtransferase
MSLQELLENEATTIVDVREPYEFAEGHIDGSINIPLNTVQNRVEEFQQMSKPLVMVCLSGGRSGMATAILKARGVENVHNGGGWQQVNQAKVAI